MGQTGENRTGHRGHLLSGQRENYLIETKPLKWLNRAAGICILLVFVLAGPLQALQAGTEGDTLIDDLENLSDLWPEFIRLREPVVSPETGRPIGQHLRGVLVRIEGGEVIADFGRNGILRLPLEATDVVSRATALSRLPKREYGLVTGSIFNKFYRLIGATPVQCKREEFNGIEYLLFVYAEPTEGEFSRFYAELSSKLASVDDETGNFIVLLIPTSQSHEAIYESLVRADFRWPVMFHYLSSGYRGSMVHPISSYPGLVLVDVNGGFRDARDSSRTTTTLQSFLQSIPDAIRTNPSRSRFDFHEYSNQTTQTFQPLDEVDH